MSFAADRLYVSNYLDGSIDVFPLAPDGAIGELLQTLGAIGSGPNPGQDCPHAHSTPVLHSALREPTVLSADLGADRVHVHLADRSLEGAALVRTETIALPPSTGPRDLLHHQGRVILLGEL